MDYKSDAVEHWLLQKEISERKKKVIKYQMQEENRIASEKSQQSKLIRQAVAVKSWNVRLQRKDKLKKEAVDLLQRQIKDKLETVEINNEKSRHRCAVEYEKWLNGKQKKLIDNEAKHWAQLQLSKDEAGRKNDLNEEAYSRWLKQTASKPFPVTYSFGLTAGKLISWKS